MWSDLNDTPDVPVEYAENVSGARSGGGMVIEFSSSTSSSTFAWAASRYDVESLSADGRQVTVRSSDDNELARLAALARNVDSRSSTREFPLGNFTTLGSAPSSNDPWQNSDDYSSFDLADLWADFDAVDAPTDVVVAIVDTGVTFPARDIPMDRFATDADGNILQYNAFTGDEGDGATDSAAEDNHGHGTFIANQIVGIFDNEIGSFGVCGTRCEIMPVKVLDDYGSGDQHSISAGITWAVDNGADVINLSLGMVAPPDAMDDPAFAEMQAPIVAALQHAAANDVIVMAAAGNHSTSWVANAAWPAAFPEATAVAAADPFGERLYFSAFSHFAGGVDIAAPGCIHADLDPSHVFSDGNATADEWCGTSMATPIAAAVAAMTRAVFPELDREQIVDRMAGFATANDYTMHGNLSGTDLLDRTVDEPALVTPPVPPVVKYERSAVLQCNEDFSHNVELRVENLSDVTDITLKVQFMPQVFESIPAEDIISAEVTAAPGETVVYNGVWPRNYQFIAYVAHEFEPDPWGTIFDPADDCWHFDTGVELGFSCHNGEVWFDVKVDTSRSINANADAGVIIFDETGEWWSSKVTSNGAFPGFTEPVMGLFRNTRGDGEFFELDGPDDFRHSFIVEPGQNLRGITDYLRPVTPDWSEVYEYEMFTPIYEVPDACANGRTDHTFYDIVTMEPANADPIPTDTLSKWSTDPEWQTTGNVVELLAGDRVLDTRNGGSVISGQATQYIQITGEGGIPDDATAATVNFTVAGASGWGFLTAWGCDDGFESPPDSSVLNYEAGWVRANTQTIGLGATGGICVWSYADIDLLIDVQGFLAANDIHMYDTPRREMNARGDGADFAAGEVRYVHAGDDVTAAFVNLTAVNAKEWGFLTVWPCDNEHEPPPNSSAANYDVGQTVANNALVAVSNGGFCVFSHGATGVLVDIMGVVHGHQTGLVTFQPTRYVDTRPGSFTFDGYHAGEGAFTDGEIRRYDIVSRGPLNDTAKAIQGVYMNVTSVNPAGNDGFLTVWACDSVDDPKPDVSALNYRESWSATPNSIVQKLSASGHVCVYAYKATDVIIDITGYVS